MSRRVGLWLIGAYGGVGSTTALGLAALANKLTDTTGMVTALADFAATDFDEPASFVVGGHDLRSTTFLAAATELHENANVLSERLIDACADELLSWSDNVQPGVLFGVNAAIVAANSERGALWSREVESSMHAIEMIRSDLESFRERHSLDAVVVVNVASTEPPFPLSKVHQKLDSVLSALEDNDPALPTSSLYAWAAVQAGCPYVNITPSLGGSFPAFEEHARQHRLPHAGQDLKTGETLIKSVLAPMFAMRNLKVLSWVGHNILGNRDGQVLADPANKSSKIRTKDALLADMLGYKPQAHTSIEYIASLDDWKTAWDHIHFSGFLDTKMTMQFTWQGCDSVLAAPLVIDLARLLLLAQRRGDSGALPPTACFFKSPLGVSEHELSGQFLELVKYLS